MPDGQIGRSLRTAHESQQSLVQVAAVAESEFASFCYTHHFRLHCSSFNVRSQASLLDQGIITGKAALSLCFLLFRVFVRLGYFQRVYTDDLFLLAADVMLLASSMVWQTQQKRSYKSSKLSTAQINITAKSLAVISACESCSTDFAPTLPMKRHLLRLGDRVRGQKIRRCSCRYVFHCLDLGIMHRCSVLVPTQFCRL